MTQSFASNALLTGDGSRIKTPASLPDVAKVLQVNADGTSEHIAAVLEAQRNVANGFAGLNGDGHLVGTIRQRTGTAAEIDAIVLANGEMAWVTDLKEMRIGDGATSGGLFAFANARLIAEFFIGSGASQVEDLPIVANGLYRFDAAGVATHDGTDFTFFANAYKTVGGIGSKEIWPPVSYPTFDLGLRRISTVGLEDPADEVLQDDITGNIGVNASASPGNLCSFRITANNQRFAMAGFFRASADGVFGVGGTLPSGATMNATAILQRMA